MDKIDMKTVDTSENQKPPTLLKSVGGTDFEIEIHFSENSKEMLWDKVLRLIKNDNTA